MLRGANAPQYMDYGNYTLATLPPAGDDSARFAYVTDDPVSGNVLYWSNGTIWMPLRGNGPWDIDWNSITTPRILNKPALATVATSGSYNDLSNKPTIPAAQIQSDWTQASTGALDYIKNKPVVSTPVLAAQLTTDSAGSVTWNYSAFGFTSAPVVEGTAQATAGTTDVVNVQLDGAPTSTQAKFKVTRTQQAVVALIGLTILSVPSTVGVTVIHAIAKLVG